MILGPGFAVFFLRQEQLWHGLCGLCDRHGLQRPSQRRVKASKRERDWRSYYTPELAEMVAQRDRELIRFAGYGFDP